MATNNSANQSFTNNADGFDIGGGTTERKLTVTGGDVTATGGATITNGQLLIGSTADNDLALATLTAGDGISVTNGDSSITIAATGGATKEEFFYFQNRDTNVFPYSSRNDMTPFVNLPSGEFARTTFYVPNDFTDIVEITLVILPDATETVSINLRGGFGALGEGPENTETNVNTLTVSATASQYAEIDLDGSHYSGLAAGDIVTIGIESNTSNVQALGIRFRYS